jgi:hypothetical protein
MNGKATRQIREVILDDCVGDVEVLGFPEIGPIGLS